MLDFTSALYLGLRHPSRSLPPWSRLTTGRPAALGVPPGEGNVACAIAKLQGCETGLLGPSTLHLFWELFTVLGEDRAAIYVDDGTYPIAQWGVERASCKGTPAFRFRHHDAEALRSRLWQDGRLGRKAIVVADGFCPGCGEPAPIADYLESVQRLGGYLVLDDTQALGIFGYSPGPGAQYGLGGGGSLRRGGVSGEEIVMVSSLAKGFGVPVACLAGSRALVRRFESRSAVRVHSSPPSAAVVRAADHALSINQRHGDTLRARLLERVERFRNALASHGLRARGGGFPVQQLTPGAETDPRLVHERLTNSGVRAVLLAARYGERPKLGFLITARHPVTALDRAADALADALVRARGSASGLEVTHGSLDFHACPI